MNLVYKDGMMIADDEYVLTHTFNEKPIIELYLRLVEDGLAEKVWYQGGLSLHWLLSWTADPRNGTILFLHVKDGKASLVGAGWVTERTPLGDTGKHKAEIGFAFFKDTPIFTAIRFGRLALKYIADVFDVDYFFGTTPEDNKQALAYAKRLGLKLVGPVPNFCSYLGDVKGVYFSSISAEEIAKKVL